MRFGKGKDYSGWLVTGIGLVGGQVKELGVVLPFNKFGDLLVSVHAW